MDHEIKNLARKIAENLRKKADADKHEEDVWKAGARVTSAPLIVDFMTMRAVAQCIDESVEQIEAHEKKDQEEACSLCGVWREHHQEQKHQWMGMMRGGMGGASSGE